MTFAATQHATHAAHTPRHVGAVPSRPVTSYIIIPARLASTRLPGKLLLQETGRTVLQHTFEAAQHAAKPAGICVATDSREIAEVVRAFGGQVCMTSPQCASGTDRVAEAAAAMSDVDIVVNVQADEPEIDAAAIDRVASLLEDNPTAVMSTVAAPIRSRRQLDDPACVKVVFDAQGRALYFSRAAVPHVRDSEGGLSDAEELQRGLFESESPIFYQHIGLYAYRREFLLRLAQMPPSRLEQLERLEQLRVLEAGQTILVGTVDEATCGIDTTADYRAFVEKVIGNG